MEKVTLKLAALATVLCLSGAFSTTAIAAKHGNNNPPPPPAMPPTVTSVDTSALTVTIQTGKSSPEVYKLTKLTTVLIDGKKGTIDGIQTGMKASVMGSSSGLSKIDLISVKGGGSAEQPAGKKDKKK
jgi:hypothetical protein